MSLKQRTEDDETVNSMRPNPASAKVAHEINNRLAGLKNAFQLVKPAVPREHLHYHYVARVENEIDRIAGIVRQMFEMSGPDATPELATDPAGTLQLEDEE